MSNDKQRSIIHKTFKALVKSKESSSKFSQTIHHFFTNFVITVDGGQYNHYELTDLLNTLENKRIVINYRVKGSPDNKNIFIVNVNTDSYDEFTYKLGTLRLQGML